VRFNRVTQLNGIQWRYDIHGRTVEKDNGQTRWRYRYDGEHRLTEVIRQPRDRNKPQTQVSFRYDPPGDASARPPSVAGGSAARQNRHHAFCLGRVPAATGNSR